MKNVKTDVKKCVSRSDTRIWACLLLLFCLVFVGKANVEAASLDKEVYLTGKEAAIRRDIDGDGKLDKIQIKAGMLDSYYYKNFKVYVNGKLALKKDIRGTGSLSFVYMSCSKKKNYLQFTAVADGGYMKFNKIYSYSAGKLVEAADLGTADNMSATVTKVSSNAITVAFSVQPYDTGRVNWTFTYRPKGKKLKLTSNTVKVSSVLGQYFYSDKYKKDFKKNKFTTRRGRTYYTTAGGNQKAFTTKPGDVVVMQKVKITGKKMYISFKKGKKTGWVQVVAYSTGGEFYYGVSRRLAG